MLDPGGDLVPPPSSPTISSVSSSSDLESASTGSFFHDRSTTLGTLMGVSSFAFRPETPSIAAEEETRRRSLLKRRGRWWWGICGDDACCGSSRRRSSASLAEFLEVERRLGEALYGGGDELVRDTREGERVLFEDGRVLPPTEHDGSVSNGVGAFRLVGLCNRGGVG